MSKTKLVYCFSIVFFLAFFYSCKIEEKENVKVKVKPRPSSFLIKKLKQKELQFNTVSVKSSVEFDDGNKKTSFNAHIRIKKDSAIWVSITPLLGIEIARILITQDTIKVINRANKEYFIGNFDYLDQLFGADLDYQMLEALLVGNSLDFEEDDKVHSRVDRKKDLYFLSTEKKRKITKEIKKDKIKKQFQVLWLNPMTFKIQEISLSSPENSRSLMGAYSNYKEINSQLVPHNLIFKLESKTISKIEIEYSKFSMGKPLSFPFNISPKYEQIKK